MPRGSFCIVITGVSTSSCLRSRAGFMGSCLRTPTVRPLAPATVELGCGGEERQWQKVPHGGGRGAVLSLIGQADLGHTLLCKRMPGAEWPVPMAAPGLHHPTVTRTSPAAKGGEAGSVSKERSEPWAAIPHLHRGPSAHAPPHFHKLAGAALADQTEMKIVH